MRQSKSWLALLCGLAAVLGGCDRPCESSIQCGSGEVCAAALCQNLACEQTMFAVDPQTGACTPLSGCFLTTEQRAWKTCSDDHCKGLAESACVTDSTCQPAYANPQIEIKDQVGGDDRPTVACAGGAAPVPPKEGGNGEIGAPGVNNGEAPKHARPDGSFSCFPNTARVFAGCRAVPTIAPRKACESLDEATCGSRLDCQTASALNGGRGDKTAPSPVPGIAEDGSDRSFFPGQGVCFTKVSINAACEGADLTSCLLNKACQPIGAKCYCPPGGKCACDGGAFIGCERNDRLRRCQSATDCGAGERCDNDEACITPRTFTTDPSSGPAPVPGTGSCLGACVPSGCAGFGEKLCHEKPECDAGAYGTVCHPKPYCAGGGRPGDPGTPEPGPEPSPDPAGGVGATCGCETEFKGCAPASPLDGLKPDRSLLVREPAVVGAPAFRLDNVIGKLAPAGRADDFVRTWFGRIGAAGQIGNGSQAGARMGFANFQTKLQQSGQLTAAALGARFHATALVNRIDLATAGDCGEARITYAMSDGYTDGNQRMTMIFELRVPDDGNACRTVAQRWGELSLIEDGAERLRRLQAIYDELLVPARLGQLRTNEFLNSFGREAWELREWHLGVDGLPELAPVKQTVDPRFAASSDLLGWARTNAAALKAGTAIVPDRFLAAVSTENGARLRLSDTTMGETEKAINALSCAGCHLTETKSPFAHVGERLGKRVAGAFVPDGRAVIDEFLQKELPTRAANLRRILSAPAPMGIMAPWRSLTQARVH